MKRTLTGLALASVLLACQTALSQYAFIGKQITLNGHDLLIDSYDSQNPNLSTGGVYDPLKVSDRGNVSSEGGIVNSIGTGNVSIWGRVSTAAEHKLDIGPESSIGSAAWHQAGQKGVEPGFLDTDFVGPFPDVVLPYTSWSTPQGGQWEGEDYKYILMNGDFIVPSLNLTGGEKLLVAGSARLYVPDDLNLKGNAAIRILPSASLTIYVGAVTANLRGTGILNEGAVSHFQYYALPANNTINIRLTTGFAGLVYAPRAVCYITTQGKASAELNGSFIVQELDLGAPVRLHYDEALGR